MIHNNSSKSSSNATWRAPTSLTAPSLLLLMVGASWHDTSAFMVPVISASTTASRASSLCKTSATDKAGGEDGADRSPAGLTLEGVYQRLKLDSIGLDDGGVSLDSTDPDYGVRLRTYVHPVLNYYSICLYSQWYYEVFPVYKQQELSYEISQN